MEKKDIHLGQAIRKILKARGISNAEFARQINISESSVGNFLNHADFYSQKLFEISKALNYDFFEFIRSENGERNVFTVEFVLSSKEDEELRTKGYIERNMVIKSGKY